MEFIGSTPCYQRLTSICAHLDTSNGSMLTCKPMKAIIRAKLGLKPIPRKPSHTGIQRPVSADGRIQCLACQLWVPLSEFYTRRHSNGNTHYDSRCNACRKLAMIARRVGLAVTRAKELLSDGRCAICKRQDTRLCIDHCHKTGRIRGVLCHRCNSGIGSFRDNPTLLTAAAAYLANS